MRAKAASDYPVLPGIMSFHELKVNYGKFLTKAVIFSCVLHLFIVGSLLVGMKIMSRPKKVFSVRLVKYTELGAPPSLSGAPPPAAVAVAAPSGPSVGIPVPVPDARAPEQTIATQAELSQMAPAVMTGSGGDSLVITDIPEVMPSATDFVYVEEVPQMIVGPQPIYPDMAREAQLEGQVIVNALIGKDGKVRSVIIVKSIPMLDDAAKQAVMKTLWKPAFNNNRPVAVWVAVPIRFTLVNR
ncbi:MAG: energy transducer TonB [Candidatus Eisenbacteria bacterium]|nr:energy transducer TonB [Candidatus Eisenbacteria bacterium]